MWENKLMPVGITSNVLQCNPNFSKREGYVNNLESNNFKNELHQAVNIASLDDLGCLSDYLYTDADNT